jgi:hypothetical protein
MPMKHQLPAPRLEASAGALNLGLPAPELAPQP